MGLSYIKSDMETGILDDTATVLTTDHNYQLGMSNLLSF